MLSREAHDPAGQICEHGLTWTIKPCSQTCSRLGSCVSCPYPSVSDWLSEPERCSVLGANRLRALVLNDRSRQPAWHVPPDAGRPGRKTRPRRVPDVAWAPGVHVALCHRFTTVR